MTQPADLIRIVPRVNMIISSIVGLPWLAMNRAVKVGQSSRRAPTGLSKRMSMRYAFIRDQFTQKYILLVV